MKPDELAFAGSCKRRKVKLEVDASGCDFAFIYAPGCEVVSRLWSSLQCLAVRVFTKQPAVFLFKATTKTRDPKPRRCSNLAKMDPPTGWKSIKGPLFVSCVGHCYFVWCLSVKTIWRFRLQLWALLLVKVKRTNVKKRKDTASDFSDTSLVQRGVQRNESLFAQELLGGITTAHWCHSAFLCVHRLKH